jgi:hypothetical protein
MSPPLRGARLARLAEHGGAVLLGALVLAVHNVGYLLSVPFWNDEAWVAVTTRYPLSQLRTVTSSTPVGWSFLLRLVTFGRGQSGRLLPLAFAAAAVVTAYWLARGLDWRRRELALTAAVLAACAALMVPAMLVRDDLKQYTADAFVALLILAGTARLERAWSRRALALLSAFIVLGLFISDAAAFVGAAALCGLVVAQAVRRAWVRLGEVVLTTAVTAGLGIGVYLAFDARAVTAGLAAYWRPHFLPAAAGFGAASHFVATKLGHVDKYFALRPWWLAIALVVAGIATVARLGRPGTAIAVAALWPEMLVLSRLQRYPFGDLRTSTFLIVVTVVTAAIGVIGLSAAVCRRLPRRRLISAAVATVIPAVALAGFCLAARPYVRSELIPDEHVRQQVDYVAAHAAPGDRIVVSASGDWGFAYYWPVGRPGRRPDPNNLQGYQPDFPDQPRIIVAASRSAAAITAALTQAVDQTKRSACARIWLVRSHIVPRERSAWVTVLADLGLRPVRVAGGASYVRAAPCRSR